MPSFNKVILMGNLTRDPQLKHLPNNLVVAEFGIACNRRYRTAAGEDKEDVAFVDCAAFGRQAETIGEYFTKGKPIFIEGRLKYDSWDDKSGNGKRSKLTVTVENFQFIGSGNQSDSERHIDESTSQDAPPPRRRPQRGRQSVGPYGRGNEHHEPEPAGGPPFGDEQQFKEDDIPF